MAAGLDLPQTMVLSLVMFSGDSPFAAVGVVGTGGSLGAVVATAGLLGARNGRYGVQLSGLLDVHGWRRALAGALLGDALGDPGRYGLDATAGAVFLGLRWPRPGGPPGGRSPTRPHRPARPDLDPTEATR